MSSTRSSSRSSTSAKLSRTTVASLIVVALFVVVAGILFLLTRPAPGPAAPADPSVLVRPDSHRLSAAPGARVTFVEFLDFECEACRDAYPEVEKLRERYAGRVEFVLRYFPLPMHRNSERAARAVEAAARQGKLEPMYKLMFDTQAEWGEQREPMDDRFRGYAQRLGLDLARYDADYADPATAERVKADKRDGETLGVQGTPTFLLNGRTLDPESWTDLGPALDDALAGR